MLQKTFMLLALAVIACASSYEVKQIYSNVAVGDYNGAVSKTKSLVRRGKGDQVIELVNKLINDAQPNTVDFAYKLHISDGADIIKDYFPLQFRMILNGHSVKLINKRDNLAMKLAWDGDDMGDRTAYGDANDKTSDRISWKFSPFSDEQKLYFKIMNIQRTQYLKAAIDADSEGDHKVYGSSRADTFRHHWYLVPSYYESQLLFFIINREYNQALKLSRALDDSGDRQVWTHKGYAIGNPNHFGWYIAAY